MASKLNKKIFDAVTRSLPDPIFIINEEGTYIDLYGGSDRAKYHNGQALIGKNVFEFLIPGKSKRLTALIMKKVPGWD